MQRFFTAFDVAMENKPQKIFCNERILLKNLDTGKVAETEPIWHFCDRNETEYDRKLHSCGLIF